MAGVLLYHAGIPWLPGGFLGVDVFFVLSGYLITSLLLAEHRRDGQIALGAFWVARARRLLPAALLVIAACLVIAAAFYRGDLDRLRGDAVASVLYVNNWHQVLGDRSYFAHFGRPSLLQHYWSLSVEEQFYLVWPPMLLAGLTWLGRRTMALAAAAAAAGSIGLMAALYHPGSDPSRVYYGTDTRAAPLMIGAVLAFAWPLGRMTARPGRGAGPLLECIGLTGLAALILAMHAWPDFDPSLYRGGFLLAALASGAVIMASVHPVTHLGRALASPPLRWLGQRSYGIYLWHWPVMTLSRPGVDLAASSWVVVPAQLALTVTLAALSYRYVEMPVRRREPPPALTRWLARDRTYARYVLAVATTVLLGAVLISATIVPASRSRPALTALATRAAALTPVPLWRHRHRPPQPQPRRPAAPQSRRGPARGPVLAVGASVMLDAAAALERQTGAKVDAAVGRQPGAIIDRLAAYRAAGALPPNVVVQIGDNAPVWGYDQARLRRALRGVTRVVLVNVRQRASWENQVNKALNDLRRTWPQATIADWRSASSDPRLLYDGAHPNAAGQSVYARTVAAALGLNPGPTATRSGQATGGARSGVGSSPCPSPNARPRRLPAIPCAPLALPNAVLG